MYRMFDPHRPTGKTTESKRRWLTPIQEKGLRAGRQPLPFLKRLRYKARFAARFFTGGCPFLVNFAPLFLPFTAFLVAMIVYFSFKWPSRFAPSRRPSLRGNSRAKVLLRDGRVNLFAMPHLAAAIHGSEAFRLNESA